MEMDGLQHWSVVFKPIKSKKGVDMDRTFRVLARLAKRAFLKAGLSSWKPFPLSGVSLACCDSRVIDDITVIVQFSIELDGFERRADILVEA